MILDILKDGDDTLRKVSIPVLLNDEVRDFIESMKETMVEHRGVGLAAPQVGRNIRIIVIQLVHGGHIQEMVNPVIKWTSDQVNDYEEGCLSIPDEVINLTRPSTVAVSFQDVTGKYKKWKLKSLEARVVQHEIDHLDGVLMTDYD